MKRRIKTAILLLSAAGAVTANAGDHFDAANVQSNPMADASSLYAWMTPDATKLNLALTVSPNDDGSRVFTPNVVYVFHVESHSAYGTAGTVTKIVCKFQSDTMHACWVGATGYVAGNASATAGITSADGKIRLFAGRRSDPFFFNLQGHRTFVNTIKSAAGALTLNAAGCPFLDNATATNLRSQLTTAPTTAVSPCPANVNDCFAGHRVKAIVLQVDVTLLNNGANKLLSVWASTHNAT